VLYMLYGIVSWNRLPICYGYRDNSDVHLHRFRKCL